MVYPFWYPAPPLDQRARLFAILSRYFRLLQDGKAGKMRPKPAYQWRYYQGEMTIKRMREGTRSLDQYIVNQIGWANSHRVEGTAAYDAGPDFGRLPDGGLMALFQEIDTMFADLGYRQEPREQ